MTTIEKFKKDHRDLIFKHEHTPKDAARIVALSFWHVPLCFCGAAYNERPESLAARIERDIKSICEIIEKVYISANCPYCGVLSGWVMMPMQTIVYAAWMIATTKAATYNDPCGYITHGRIETTPMGPVDLPP